ncbi:MAG: HD domain-containing protein [Clostridium sp.]|uniref:HD-GYP domain-containing protein n=1 Tax=Clostridium sp. TaxID=1506 RepID=UPI002FC69AAC
MGDNVFIMKDNIYNKYGGLVIAKGTKIILDDKTIDRLVKMGIDFKEIANESRATKITPHSKETQEMKRVGNEMLKENSILERISFTDTTYIETTKNVEKAIFNGKNSSWHIYLKSFYNALPWYYSHSINVAIISSYLATKLGFSMDSIDSIIVGSLLHDIGMMLVPKSIISKQKNSLTEYDEEILKRHCEMGYSIVLDSGIPELSKKIILQHHELIDGSGYPNRFKDKQIIKEAKIVMLSDIFDLQTYSLKGKDTNIIIESMISNTSKYPYEYVKVLKAAFE